MDSGADGSVSDDESVGDEDIVGDDEGVGDESDDVERTQDDYEVGDDFACPGCGDTHDVRRGSGLSVGGAPAAVDRSLYVRCPAAGVVALPNGRAPPPTAFEADDGGEEWP